MYIPTYILKGVCAKIHVYVRLCGICETERASLSVYVYDEGVLSRGLQISVPDTPVIKVSRSPLAVQALVPDVIRVKQWPLRWERRVQRHSCMTGAGIRPVAVTAGRDVGSERAIEAQLDS